MSETLVRAISGAVYIAILLTACWYSEWSFKILIGIFLVLATVEFSKLIKFNAFVGFVIAIGFYGFYGYLIPNNGFNPINIAIVGFSLITSIWLLKNLFSSESLTITNNFSKYLLFIGYIVFPFILLSKIPYPEMYSNSSNVSIRQAWIGYEPLIIIIIFLMIWINDTFAYLVGKTFGKHKLFEKISPKKTIEGFLGGAIFTIIFSFFIPTFFDWNKDMIWFWIVQAVIIVIFATLGDLVESKFKRSANVKDSGNIMPGHGGILDRLDSIIFVAPFIFLFYQILNYVS